MTANVPLIVRVLASSVSVANRAGKIVRDVMSKGELGIVEKGKDDYQTEADRSAQRCIVASLAAQYPKVNIIGEEDQPDNETGLFATLHPQPGTWKVIDGDIASDLIISDADKEILGLDCPIHLQGVKEEDIVVWVDPLDGTSEYTQGFLEHVTVLIGISVNEKPVAGVIHQPYYKTMLGGEKIIGRTIWGLQEVGVGGFTPAPPPDSLIITTTRSHSNPLVEKALQVMNAAQVLRVGGAGYKVLQLLEGKASIYVFASSGCKKWDTCAPEAVLTAAGGKLTDILGDFYKYGGGESKPNKTGVLAAVNGELHNYALKRIPQELKDALANK
ncbi:3'(2'),5'-bisphosphate nucleotidase 1 isoform X3 [Helicoverpa zea]|uniref:3'(2'),5'-bisphosphate nucleotidase 1 isoform X3 n=1 Tax=Helicoverpa zea TaxID=7113 RepID=UPI001F56ED30|nr:3'(2'),5'-bisphosphate nucleotidase 1 isoform X3 [Helicoverpa zea]